LRTIPEITNAIKAGGACMSCHHTPGGLQDLLDETWGTRPAQLVELPVLPDARATAPLPRGPEMSPYKFAKKVEQVVDEYVRPTLQQDGGDIEIVDIKETLVYARFNGACSTCAAAHRTLKMLVEQTLKDQVDARIRVIQV